MINANIMNVLNSTELYYLERLFYVMQVLCQLKK